MHYINMGMHACITSTWTHHACSTLSRCCTYFSALHGRALLTHQHVCHQAIPLPFNLPHHPAPSTPHTHDMFPPTHPLLPAACCSGPRPPSLARTHTHTWTSFLPPTPCCLLPAAQGHDYLHSHKFEHHDPHWGRVLHTYRHVLHVPPAYGPAAPVRPRWVPGLVPDLPPYLLGGCLTCPRTS